MGGSGKGPQTRAGSTGQDDRAYIHIIDCFSQNNCKVNKIENTLNSEIKLAILKKAAQIENEDLVKKKEDSTPYKLPKNY